MADKLAVLIPASRKHRHRYCPAVTAYAGFYMNAEVPNTDPTPMAAEDLPEAESGKPSPAQHFFGRC
ncbi:MAG: hypothetical protein ACRERV_08105 [Methylococcales bacterium]